MLMLRWGRCAVGAALWMLRCGAEVCLPILFFFGKLVRLELRPALMGQQFNLTP